MTRPLSELFEEAASLQGELYDHTCSAEQIRAALKKHWPDWSEEDRADLVFVASRLSWAEAQAIEQAVSEFVSYSFVVARALGKFGRRRNDKIERVAETGRRAAFFERMTVGTETVEEPRRSGGRRPPPPSFTDELDQE